MAIGRALAAFIFLNLAGHLPRGFAVPARLLQRQPETPLALVAQEQQAKRQQAPSVQANPSPNLEENTFMHKTWGFLRSSSDKVGSAAADVLALQQNLQELQENVNVEYTAWGETKAALLKDNEQLRNTKAHLTGELQQQAALHLELTRLQETLAESDKALAWEHKSLEQQVAQWNAEKQVLAKSVADIEAQIKAVAAQQLAEKKAAAAALKQLREANKEQQLLVLERNKELLKQNNALAELKIDAGRNQSKLIQTNKESMQEIERLQKEVVQTAQVQHALLSLKARVGAQVDQKVQQEALATQLEKQCQEDADSLDAQIKEVAKQKTEFRQEMNVCQAMDGENQRLLNEVNACHAKNAR